MKAIQMNLNQTPTEHQLHALLAAADDGVDHHILWVDASGQVNLTWLDDSVVLTEFSKAYPHVPLRFEAFCVGNGYVGNEAAADAHVNRYFGWLCEAWANAAGARPCEIFIDSGLAITARRVQSSSTTMARERC
jgi:hypothetical protein